MNKEKFKLETKLYVAQLRAPDTASMKPHMTPLLKREFDNLAAMRGTAKNAATKAIGFRNAAELQGFMEIARMRKNPTNKGVGYGSPRR